LKKSCSLLDILRPASGRETLRRTPDGRRRHAGDAKQANPYRQTDRDTPFAHPTIMMRKKVYDALGGYRVGHKNMRAEDLDLWIRFFEAGYKGYNIQEVLYRYHESRDDLYKRSVKVAIHTMAAFWYGYRVLNVPFYKRIWVLKPLVAALIPKWIMEKYHRIRLDKV